MKLLLKVFFQKNIFQTLFFCDVDHDVKLSGDNNNRQAYGGDYKLHWQDEQLKGVTMQWRLEEEMSGGMRVWHVSQLQLCLLQIIPSSVRHYYHLFNLLSISDESDQQHFKILNKDNQEIIASVDSQDKAPILDTSNIEPGPTVS